MSTKHQSAPNLGLWSSGPINSSHAESHSGLIITIALAALALTAFFALVFMWGQLVARNDEQLLRLDDARHVRMLARACGAHGQIWRSPQTGNYACVYTNAGGAVMVEAIPDKPYLATIR